MPNETTQRQQVQSFLLRLTRDSADADWKLLLKPIEGNEYFLFTDVASLVAALVEVTTPKAEIDSRHDK